MGGRCRMLLGLLPRRRWHLLPLGVLLSVLLLSPGCGAFECFTGDKDILRRKVCPSFGKYDFSDVCFKKVGSEDPDDVQRGCFNRLIGQLITENADTGCHQIPRKYGTGTICLCDKELCNGTSRVGAAAAVSVAVALVLRAVT